MLFLAHQEDPEFGCRLLADEAAREHGEQMADRTAWRVCADSGWRCAFGEPLRRNAKRPGPAVHDDLVERIFAADAPEPLWLTDIAEHWTREGMLYICAVNDVHSNRIVGCSIDSRMDSRLAVTAVNNAGAVRHAAGETVAGCIVHSDRGSQLVSRKPRRALAAHSLVGSMGRVAAAGDNAAMESFYSLLQNNVLDRQTWATREDLRIAMGDLDRADLSPPP